MIPFRLFEASYVFPVVSSLQRFDFFHTDVSVHRWELRTAMPPVTPDLRPGGLRNFTQLGSWIGC